MNYQPDNYIYYLCLTEFTAKNYVSNTTGISLFFGDYGLHCNINFELDRLVYNPEEPMVCHLANHLSNIHNLMKTMISFPQD
jgi:hypothetical protein